MDPQLITIFSMHIHILMARKRKICLCAVDVIIYNILIIQIFVLVISVVSLSVDCVICTYLTDIHNTNSLWFMLIVSVNSQAH